MSFKNSDAVKRVIAQLEAAGLGERVIELESTARSAQDAANAVGAELGAIVKSLAFKVGNETVLALIAGDHMCLERALPRALNMKGRVTRPLAEVVKRQTGFTIGGVAPVGALNAPPAVIDASLRRFKTLYAAAGHPHCVFPVSFDELKRLTGGVVSHAVSEPISGAGAPMGARFPRSRTFQKRMEEGV